jgi:MFS family permease
LAGLFSVSGAAFGPVIAGLIYDATQDYRIAFTIFAAASLLAMVAVFFARPPVRPLRFDEHRALITGISVKLPG